MSTMEPGRIHVTCSEGQEMVAIVFANGAVIRIVDPSAIDSLRIDQGIGKSARRLAALKLRLLAEALEADQ